MTPHEIRTLPKREILLNVRQRIKAIVASMRLTPDEQRDTAECLANIDRQIDELPNLRIHDEQ
jgi:hypothetical protein